jgi:hypothetical protein
MRDAGTKRATADEAIGMAWWNNLTERQRLAALYAVDPEGRASAAEAFDLWKQTGGFCCEETAHG